MASPPLISVLLPCFNAAETLLESLESVRAQTIAVWELLIVDDGSTDSSREIAQRLILDDSRARLISMRHEGIVAALKKGSQYAQGKFIARMDADDVAHPERFERQLQLMESHPRIGLCGTGVRAIGGEVGEGRLRYLTWINRLTAHEAIVHELFVECPIAHPTFFMRREAFDAAGGYQDAAWPEDYDLVMRTWLSGWELGNVPETLLDWRDRPDRLSMVDPRYDENHFRALKRYYLGIAGILPETSKPSIDTKRAFYQWGAGEVGKRWLREWRDVKPIAVVDIHPRKIGATIHGTPVIAADNLPEPGSVVILIAVGAPGARDEIRAWLNPRGYNEGSDYRFIA